MTEQVDEHEVEEDDDWFFTGEEGEQEMERNEAERAASRVRRFWLPVDATRESRITFVDDDTVPSEHLKGKLPPFQFYEHQLYLNGRWTNWFSCLGKGKCPLCQSGDKAYFAGVYTIIDHTEWKDRGGKVHKDEPRLFVAKTDVLRLIKHISKKRGGLRGLRLDVMRKAPKDANVGSHFDFVDRVELADEVQPYPYREVLQRKTAEELLKIVGTKQDEEDEIKF